MSENMHSGPEALRLVRAMAYSYRHSELGYVMPAELTAIGDALEAQAARITELEARLGEAEEQLVQVDQVLKDDTLDYRAIPDTIRDILNGVHHD